MTRLRQFQSEGCDGSAGLRAERDLTLDNPGNSAKWAHPPLSSAYDRPAIEYRRRRFSAIFNNAKSMRIKLLGSDRFPGIAAAQRLAVEAPNQQYRGDRQAGDQADPHTLCAIARREAKPPA